MAYHADVLKAAIGESCWKQGGDEMCTIIAVVCANIVDTARESSHRFSTKLVDIEELQKFWDAIVEDGKNPRDIREVSE
uniref:HD_domain domain-containing protein n=1 Tax=Steinernema glaseri TaxID=37863 RepID=A0A1I7YAQ2_9BILA